MRIRTVGVLAVFGLALLASGCGGDKPSTTPTAKAGGKLVIWADDKRAEVLKSFKDKFEKDNGVTVDGTSHGPGAQFQWKLGETLVLGGGAGQASSCTLTLSRTA